MADLAGTVEALPGWFDAIRTPEDLVAIPANEWCVFGPLARCLVLAEYLGDLRRARAELEGARWVLEQPDSSGYPYAKRAFESYAA